MIKIPPVVLGILGILGSPVYKRSENCYCTVRTVIRKHSKKMKVIHLGIYWVDTQSYKYLFSKEKQYMFRTFLRSWACKIENANRTACSTYCIM